MFEKNRADLTIMRAMNAATKGTRINSEEMLGKVGVSCPIRVEASLEISSQSARLRTIPVIPLAKPFKTNLPTSFDSPNHSESKPMRKAGHIVHSHLLYAYNQKFTFAVS